MNITELARQLKVSTQELRDALPALGFDIGQRAIKVDDRAAEQIIKKWAETRRARKIFEAAPISLEEAPAAAEEPKAAPLPIPAVITVRGLAEKIQLPVSRVIAELMKNGVLATLNERIDYETAAIIAEDLGFAVTREKLEPGAAAAAEVITLEQRLKTMAEEAPERLKPRPPVVVIMGHVDHGKTKLLDAIRLTNVAAGEAGGITQHIGAYQVTVRPKGEPSSLAATESRQGIPSKKSTGSFGPAGAGPQDDDSQKRIITFIDTPGHEAFTVMRSRGARVADIAVLVVAADDGVQPQTVEAAKIIQAAKTPMLVALNKVDKPEANLDKVKSQLAEIGLAPEEWGGKTVVVPVSAKTKQGLDSLLDTILLVAEMEKEKIAANPERLAVGTVIEAHVDRGEGAVATVLVQTGTLNLNDNLAVGDSLYGRVRAMKDYRGARLNAAPPGTPVKVLGFKVAPAVGDILEVPETKNVKNLTRVRPGIKTPEAAAPASKPAEAEKEKKVLAIVLKTDVLGSLEAIVGSIDKFIHPEVAVKIIGKGLGNVTDAEILAAEAAPAVIYGFNVQVIPAAAELARDKGVEIKFYTIIYDLLDDIKDRLEKLLAPEKVRTILGKIKVLAVFRSERDYQIVGGAVADGKAISGAKVRALRGEAVLGEGTLLELQSGKRAISEVFMGQECGLKVRGKLAMAVGDVLEIFTEEEIKRKFIF